MVLLERKTSDDGIPDKLIQMRLKLVLDFFTYRPARLIGRNTAKSMGMVFFILSRYTRMKSNRSR